MEDGRRTMGIRTDSRSPRSGYAVGSGIPSAKTTSGRGVERVESNGQTVAVGRWDNPAGWLIGTDRLRLVMGLFSRFKTGWTLAMDSLDVLRQQPELAAFPLVGGAAGAVYLGLLLGGASLIGLDRGPMLYAVLFVLYLGSSFIAAFFTAGLMYSVKETFEGREPSLRDGLSAAWRKRRLLFAWAIISAIVGVILRAVEREDNLVARIAAALFSVAWGILTYFIIPVILFEDVDARSMFRRSGETFKNTWGETVGAGFGVGLITALFAIVGVALALVVIVVLGGSLLGFLGGIVFAVIIMLAVYLFGATLGGIAKTALYVYATEGERPPEFDNVDFGSVVR